MSSHVLRNLVGFDTVSSPSVPESPDSGLYAGESVLQQLEGQQDSRFITVDPVRLCLVVCPSEYARILTRNERLPLTSSTGQPA
jgi:hypothetical protein